MKKSFFKTTGLLGLTLISAPHLAMAQTGGGSHILEEVIVTAQKRSETLQSIPIAITAVTAETLQSGGVQGTQDLGLITPSLNMVSAIGYSQPRLRGVGVQGNGPGIENSVATYVDDVYYASVPAALLSLNNIAQVEILKGPQGTLFGRNASGGVIQVITKDPSTDFSGNASASYSSYDTSQADFYITGGVDMLAADLAVMWTEQGEGYGENLFTGEEVNRTKKEVSVRSKWKLEPTDTTTLRFVVDYVTNDSTMGAIRPPPAPAAKPTLSFGAPAPGDDHDVNANVEPRHTLETNGASLRWDQDIADFQLVSITAYRESTYDYNIDFDLTPLPGVAVVTTQRDRQFSQELQLISPDDDKLTWMTGLFYFRASGKYDPTAALLNVPNVPFERIDIFADHTTDSYAAFAQSTLALNETTNLTLGARYTYETRGFDAEETGVFPGGFSIPLLTPEQANPDDETFKKPTWRVSLDHEINLDTLAYVSYNRGFKSGGFNAGAPTGDPYSPEVLDAYEIGLKTAVLDRSLRLNSALFYYDYSNLQVARFVGGQIDLYNGANATIYGLDFDFQALLSDALTLSGGLTYLHARYDEFPNADFYTPLPNGGSIPSKGDAKDNHIGQTPEVVTNLSLDYRVPIAGGETTFNLSYLYNDGWFAEPENRLEQDAYHLVNASVAWQSPSERYTVKVWGRNLTDELIAMQLAASPTGDAAAYMPPRTYGITLRTDF